jgi:hypothetical protein
MTSSRCAERFCIPQECSKNISCIICNKESSALTAMLNKLQSRHCCNSSDTLKVCMLLRLALKSCAFQLQRLARMQGSTFLALKSAWHSHSLCNRLRACGPCDVHHDTWQVQWRSDVWLLLVAGAERQKRICSKPQGNDVGFCDRC